MTETARRVRSATHLRDRLDAVIDCTLWCLGCDVRYPDGNLLVAGGFARYSAPPGRTAATMYRRADPRTGTVLAVWGFAILYADAETGAQHTGTSPVCVPGPALSLSRHAGLGPRLSRGSLSTPCWTTDDYPEDVTPATPDARHRAARLLRGLADEIAHHERWITSYVGGVYRAACDADRPRHVRRRQRLPAPWLADAWDALATSYAVLLTTPSDENPADAANTPPPSTPRFPPSVRRAHPLNGLRIGGGSDVP